MQTEPRAYLDEICDLLAPGRRWIYRSKVWAAVSRALANTLTVLVVVTFLALGFAGAGWAWTGGWALAIGSIVAAGLLIAWIISALCSAQVSLVETAERLDLTLRSLNQIATTYDLAASAVCSSFAQQQIKEGLSLLRASCNSKPEASPVDWKWRSNLARLLVVLAGIGMLQILHVPSGPTQAHHRQNADTHDSDSTSIQANAKERSQPPNNNRMPPTDDHSMTSLALASDGQAEKSPSALLNRPSVLDIATAGSAGFASSTADNASVSNSVNSKLPSKQSAGSNSKPSPGERSGGSSATGEPANSDKMQQNSDVQNGVSGDGSSHGSGNKPDSPSPPSLSDLGNPRREAGSSGTPPNGETDGASTGSKSRREGQAASSNQPSAAGHQDQPTHGRGDASSQSKKSRGVGSLMLGTPVPDLVIGRLSPGNSTMSRREIPPDPSNSQSILPVDTSSHGSTVESQLARFDLPPTDAGDLASHYLIQLHSDDSAEKSPRESGNGSAAPPQTSGAISH